ncbi:VOC family protein [Maribacter sp. PR1]|uniref:VOC family protein n=1 Tax=Maribacter cobaltidurans TaxID=1178778 RepID=A0ABU7J033_9FLAO|nr:MULTISPECIES: VOC family protein [Maribacter]MDC6391157.1 VOC family protein [Maribacter sp. PR1]MEE1978548.1 VOC family protein [Maribacter cobaltidurans]
MNNLNDIKYRTTLIVFATLIFQFVGCKQLPEKSEETEKLSKVNFHHIHLNVTDRDSTIAYYQKYFGATQIKYRERVDALFTEKSFLLMNLVDTAPPTHLGSSLWHIGWSGVDGQSEFDWRVNEGIAVHTNITPLGDNFWMYFLGPEKEVIEVYTGNKNHRFEHIHLLSSDVDKTMNWFESNLGFLPVYKEAKQWQNNELRWKWNLLTVNNINIIVFGKPVEEESWWTNEEIKPTDGSSIDHIGFSTENIEFLMKKMKFDGLDIVHNIKIDSIHGMKSFFVRGPDSLLVEIVEEKPIPEGIWR